MPGPVPIFVFPATCAYKLTCRASHAGVLGVRWLIYCACAAKKTCTMKRHIGQASPRLGKAKQYPEPGATIGFVAFFHLPGQVAQELIENRPDHTEVVFSPCLRQNTKVRILRRRQRAEPHQVPHIRITLGSQKTSLPRDSESKIKTCFKIGIDRKYFPVFEMRRWLFYDVKLRFFASGQTPSVFHVCLEFRKSQNHCKCHA